MIPSRRPHIARALLQNWTVLYENIHNEVVCITIFDQPSAEAASADAKARFPAILSSNVLAIIRADSEKTVEAQLAARVNLTGYPAGNPIKARKF